MVVMKISAEEAPLCLISNYYSLNIEFPKGVNIVLTLLAIKLFEVKFKKVPAIVDGLVKLLISCKFKIYVEQFEVL